MISIARFARPASSRKRLDYFFLVESGRKPPAPVEADESDPADQCGTKAESKRKERP